MYVCLILLIEYVYGLLTWSVYNDVDNVITSIL